MGILLSGQEINMSEIVEESKNEEENKVVMPSFEEALKDEGFNKSIKSYVDSAVSKGVDTYKKGAFEDAVNKAMEERVEKSKHKTPDQLRIEEMSTQMERMNQQLIERELAESRAKNKNTALKELTDKGMPTGLIDFVIDDTEEATISNINGMTDVINNYLQGIKSEDLKHNNIKVPNKENTSVNGIKEPAEGASKEEWRAYWKSTNK